MALRTIDLAGVDDAPERGMAFEEMRAELRLPRAERRGLSPMPEDMCMSEGDELGLVASSRRQHAERVAAQARASADAQGEVVL